MGVEAGWKRDPGPFREAIDQLSAYFEGEREAFDLPIALEGTDFQKGVWEALRKLPFGERISYGELARRIGRPSASRAVGMANGRNRIGIIIPCHRVIATGGSLGGYGGGLGRKQWLLEHEASLVARAKTAVGA
jgi:methylated-DNA-[protein]-cysteine S-methyltransferase